MKKVSFIIPSRNERFLPQTVSDILKNATGDFEILVVLDGYSEKLPDDPRITVIQFGKSHGMRQAINAAAAIAKGNYYIKCDAHCAFEYGFDEILLRDIDDDWIVIPRRDRLDAEQWALQNTGKRPIDYHYLSCPITNEDGYSMHGAIDNKRAKERSGPEFMIDETMSFQGSFWMMSARHYHKFLGGMSEEGYGSFTQEPQEIGMKTWLGGGRVMTNKNTTYLHLHKGPQLGRGYTMNRDEIKAGHLYSAQYWMNNKWEKRIHDIEWLIDRFSPVPTWPQDWTQRRNDYIRIDL